MNIEESIKRILHEEISFMNENDSLEIKKPKHSQRKSQMINQIHQKIKSAFHNTKNPDTKKRLKKVHDFIQKSKEVSRDKTNEIQEESELNERCWKGYTQKGMKTMFGKKYPNCVKVKK
jgi:hypothetical protein